MFSKGTSWTRGYATRNLEAWYASGRRTFGVQVAFDEELLVLRHHGRSAGAAVSGSESYDVLRWDGSCVSLQPEEITWRRPPAPKQAPIAWRLLDSDARAALLQDPKVWSSAERRRNLCTDGTDAACIRAETSLSRTVAERVRAGARVPLPTELP